MGKAKAGDIYEIVIKDQQLAVLRVQHSIMY